MDETAITTVRGKGQVTIPADLRAAAGIDEGTVVEMSVTERGVLEVRPKVLVNAEDAWFWTAEWQAGEREASAQLAAGKGMVYASDDEFLAALGDE